MYVITKDEYESLQMKLAGYEERVKTLENLVADYDLAMDRYVKENLCLKIQLNDISEICKR